MPQARLTLRSLRLASFPLWPSQYDKLSNDDVFPEDFWETKSRTALVASTLGLSWAGCAVADRLPTHTTMRTIVYSAYQSIRFPEVLGDYLEDKSDDLNLHSNRFHQPIEMKTMPPPGTPPVSPQTISQTKLTKCGRKPHSYDSTISFLGETIVVEVLRPGGKCCTKHRKRRQHTWG
jgi:hypothetical protein